MWWQFAGKSRMNYTFATDGCPIRGGDSDAQGFALCVHWYVLLEPHPWCQPDQNACGSYHQPHLRKEWLRQQGRRNSARDKSDWTSSLDRGVENNLGCYMRFWNENSKFVYYNCCTDVLDIVYRVTVDSAWSCFLKKKTEPVSGTLWFETEWNDLAQVKVIIGRELQIKCKSVDWIGLLQVKVIWQNELKITC